MYDPKKRRLFGYGWSDIEDGFESTWNAAAGGLTYGFDYISRGFGQAVKAASDIADDINDALGDAFEWISDLDLPIRYVLLFLLSFQLLQCRKWVHFILAWFSFFYSI